MEHTDENKKQNREKSCAMNNQMPHIHLTKV